MSFAELLLLSLGLSMDCFAVALTLGNIQRLQINDKFRLSLVFGVIQGTLPIVGWLIGITLHDYITRFDHWIAFIILAFIGTKMIIHAFQKEKDSTDRKIITWSLLFTLGLATSIDALITGFGLGFIGVNIFVAAVVIGSTTFILSFAGAWLGKRTTFIPVTMAEITGGVVLIAIGAKILIEHLAA